MLAIERACVWTLRRLGLCLPDKPTSSHAGLIARLSHYAVADRSNASHFGEGPVRDGMSRRAQALEDAIVALGGVPPSLAAPPVVRGGDEIVAADEAASRAAPTRA